MSDTDTYNRLLASVIAQRDRFAKRLQEAGLLEENYTMAAAFVDPEKIGRRKASQADILEAAAKIVNKRMDGTLAIPVEVALEELAEGIRWCEDNGESESRVGVMFDMHWRTP